ncbi:MAG: tRNA (adenosine(37)-N6)-dimethylallyltransferase MiaA [Oscillospiraceae bacterium]|jgi:tRNA dimethylallyltransferase|nr:tRNA (adenosine(37)-N6)-dimethylallyltransferase MiaA [Oscillospiraceae bacterium]
MSGSRSVIVITGPTATGKTALGVAAARALGGEVVSADSMQVYRYMDIGTAKPTPEETAGIPHHMLDVASPFESYSAARYVEEASRAADDILTRGKLPILVGGTGLYIESLLSGRDFALRGDRERFEQMYDAVGGEHMLEKLRVFDPERAACLHGNDKRRIVRAFEIFDATGMTVSQHDDATRRLPPRYDAVQFALDFTNRRALYDRIDGRVDAMLAAGLVREVQSLLDMGVPPEATAMQAIGYKELAAAVNREGDLRDAADAVKQRSRRYAKRQLTWLRGRGRARWIKWEKTPDFDLGLHILTKSTRDGAYIGDETER